MLDFPTDDNMQDFPTDSLDLFQSILISSADGEQSHFVTGSNNNDKTDQNERPDSDIADNKMVDENKLEATTEKSFVKPKKGRPPSKPPTKEVVRKRRKVC